MHLKSFSLLLGLLATPSVLCRQDDDQLLSSRENDKDAEVVKADVVVVGGGASGTYATWLLKKAGMDVVLIERLPLLGGHVDTYVDPKTDIPINFGVQAYMDVEGLASEFFDGIGLKYQDFPLPEGQSQRIFDFKLGTEFFPDTDADVMEPAITAWLDIADNYASYVYPTFASKFDMPEALLVPFKEFVDDRPVIEPLVRQMFVYTSYPNLQELPALFAVQEFQRVHVEHFILGISPLIGPKSGDNREVYQKALAKIRAEPDAARVFVESAVASAKRNGGGVTLEVETKREGPKVVKAKTLIMAVPPVLQNMAVFDLDNTEREVVEQLTHNEFYPCVIKAPGLKHGDNYWNIDTGNPPYNLPVSPAVWAFVSSPVPGYFVTSSLGGDGFSWNKGKDIVREALKAMKYEGNVDTAKVDFSACAPHWMQNVRPHMEAMGAGAYSKMEGLQGRRSTYYVGRTWASDWSPMVWKQVRELIEREIVPSPLGSVLADSLVGTA